MKNSENLKLVCISLLAILGLVACGKQGPTETVASKTSGNPQQIAPLIGTYTAMLGGGDFAVITRYSDGAYFDCLYNANQGKATINLCRVGKCQQDSNQLNCKQTGMVNFQLGGKDLEATNVEFSELIKMEDDGSYSTQRTRLIVDGQPRSVEGEWSSKYSPSHEANQPEKAALTRSKIPSQFFQ